MKKRITTIILLLLNDLLALQYFLISLSKIDIFMKWVLPHFLSLTLNKQSQTILKTAVDKGPPPLVFAEDLKIIFSSSLWIFVSGIFLLNLIAYLLYMRGKNWGKQYIHFWIFLSAPFFFIIAVITLAKKELFGLYILPAPVWCYFAYQLIHSKVKKQEPPVDSVEE